MTETLGVGAKQSGEKDMNRRQFSCCGFLLVVALANNSPAVAAVHALFDLRSPTTGPNCLLLVLSHEHRLFAPERRYTVGIEPQSVVAGDFNHDGVLDLAVVNVHSNSVSVFLGLGDGTFGIEHQFGVGIAPKGVVLGDFNGDGMLDLAVTHLVSNDVSVLINNTRL